MTQQAYVTVENGESTASLEYPDLNELQKFPRIQEGEITVFVIHRFEVKNVGNTPATLTSVSARHRVPRQWFYIDPMKNYERVEVPDSTGIIYDRPLDVFLEKDKSHRVQMSTNFRLAGEAAIAFRPLVHSDPDDRYKSFRKASVIEYGVKFRDEFGKQRQFDWSQTVDLVERKRVFENGSAGWNGLLGDPLRISR